MKYKMHYRASHHLFNNAKHLRQHPTEAEDFLWQYLRANQTGFKYRRQHPIARYVVDFYCHALKLVIEIDGSVHDDPIEQISDANREVNLSAEDLCIIRFSNEEVLHEIVDVMNTLHRVQYLLHHPEAFDKIYLS